MSDDTPLVAHDVGVLSAELRAVLRELRELRTDIKSFRDETQKLSTQQALADQSIRAAHRRLDDHLREHVEKAKPWAGVLPSVVAAVIVAAITLLGSAYIYRPDAASTSEAKP